MGMGIRTKQIDMDELHSVLDLRYGSPGNSIDVTISTNWSKLDGDKYFTQTIENINDTFTVNTKMIVHARTSINKTYEENLMNDNLFAHIVKIKPGDKSITLYSNIALESSLDLQILFFN